MPKLPKIVNEGAYGCVHRPSLRCDKNMKQNINYSDKVSKIMSSKNAEQELREYLIVKNVDEQEKYYLGEPIHCDYKKDKININAIKKCDLYKKTLNEKNKYELIVMKDGGDNLKDFAQKIKNNSSMNDNEKQKIMDNFWREALRLLHGVRAFLKHDVVHHDIKPHNIVYDETKNRCNFIDFGIMAKISELKKSAKAMNDSYYGHYWWNYPIESDFVKMYTFNKLKLKFLKQKDPFVFKVERSSNLDQLSTFFSFANILEHTEKENYLMGWYNFVRNHVEKYSYDQFLEKHMNTRDSYALGMSLLYVLNTTKKYVDNNKFLAFENLFLDMFSSNLHDRIDINTAIERYKHIILDDIFEKLEKMDEGVLKEVVGKKVDDIKINQGTANKIAELEPPMSAVAPLKKCPEGKILNLKTNRCIKAPKNAKKLTEKKCPEGKVLNPKTKRCIKAPKNATVKKCPEGKVLNPKTNRCIKIKK